MCVCGQGRGAVGYEGKKKEARSLRSRGWKCSKLQQAKRFLFQRPDEEKERGSCGGRGPPKGGGADGEQAMGTLRLWKGLDSGGPESGRQTSQVGALVCLMARATRFKVPRPHGPSSLQRKHCASKDAHL